MVSLSQRMIYVHVHTNSFDSLMKGMRSNKIKVCFITVHLQLSASASSYEIFLDFRVKVWGNRGPLVRDPVV